jgi:endonuclease-3
VAEWKAFCFRHLLTHVFESFYAFDFDSLLRKSNEQANRLLGRVPELSQFARNYTVKQCMEVHLLPLDERMRDALAWLGLGTAGQTPQRTGSALKTVVRKGDADRFCGLVRCLATDPKAIKIMVAEIEGADGAGFELSTAVERLKTLFAEIDTRKPKATSQSKSAAKKTTATKKPAKKASQKSSKKVDKKVDKKPGRKASKRG